MRYKFVSVFLLFFSCVVYADILNELSAPLQNDITTESAVIKSAMDEYRKESKKHEEERNRFFEGFFNAEKAENELTIEQKKAKKDFDKKLLQQIKKNEIVLGKIRNSINSVVLLHSGLNGLIKAAAEKCDNQQLKYEERQKRIQSANISFMRLGSKDSAHDNFIDGYQKGISQFSKKKLDCGTLQLRDSFRESQLEVTIELIRKYFQLSF